jgi:hypothetical protein
MAEKVKFVIEVDDKGGAQIVDDLNKKVEETGKTTEKANGKFAKLGEQLAGIKGPVGQAVQTVQGLGTAFKALIANPIGLAITVIVTALTALYKAFTSTKEGAETMQQIFDGVSATLDVLRDRALQLGSGIKQIFSGDIKAGLASIKGSFSGITEEIVKEAKEAANLRKQLQGITDDQRELNKDRALQNKLVAESKLQINDETLSYQKRLKALEEVRKSEVGLAKREEDLAKRRYEAIQAQNALSDSSQEALDAEANAYIELQNAQRASLAIQKELFDQEKSLRDRQKSEAKAAAAEKAAKDKEEADAKKAIADEEFNEWLAQELARNEYAEKLRKERMDADEAEFQAWLAQELANYEYREELQKKDLENSKKIADEKKKLEEATFQAISQGLSGVAQLVGQNSQLGKAISIAQAVINTYEGASKALAQGGIVGPIAAAGVIASGLAQVRAITQTQLPTAGGGGGGSAPSVAMPSVGIVSGQMNQTNQLQAQLNSQMSKPTRAYVVGQNVTSQQSLDRHILQNATL